MHTRFSPNRRRNQLRARRRLAPLAAALIALIIGLGAARALYAASVSALVIAATPSPVVEGASVVVEVSLTDPVLEGLVTVNVRTFDGPAGSGGAQAGSDYTAVNQTLLFLPGTTSQTVTIPTGDDSTDEANEVFDVQASLVSAPSGVTVVGTPRSTVVIEDNDGQAFTGFSADSAAVDEDAGTASFTLTLGGVTAQAVRVGYTVLGGSGSAATPGTDTAVSTGTWFIPANTSSASVTLGITNDAIYEGDETFKVRIDSVIGATSTPPLPTSADVTITDDDPAPTVSVADTSVTEGTGGSVDMTFTISLSNPSTQAVTVSYATGDGSATQPGDYASASGTATITAGSTSTTVNVAIVTDSIDEDSETLTLTIASPVNATLGTAAATGTINDDDLGPAMTIDDVTVTEGNSGTTSAVFTVSLASPSSRNVTVSYATAGGSATSPADFTSASGTLQIDAGDTAGTITVSVIGDTLDEASETFTVALTNASGASLAGGTASGTGTITDDDVPPTVSVNDPTLPAEGNSGATSLPVTVSLSAASGQTVTVELSTVAGGTATAPADYAAIAASTVTFAPGETTKDVNLSVAGDALDEDNETVNLSLANPTNATIGDGSGTATITDDDASPAISVADISVTETDAPATATATLTVQISAASGRAVSVSVQTADGTATEPADYTALAATVVTIPAGQTSATVDVTVLGDALYEGSETFTLELSGETNATVSDASATATIQDNDRPTVAFSAASSAAGEGAGTATVTVSLSSPVAAGDSVSVAFGAGGTAVAADYTLATASPITFAPGDSSKTITLNLTDDALDEADETVILTLGSPGGATLGATTGHTLTITDNDTPPAVRFSSASSAIGESISGAVVLVELSAASGQTVTVDYTVSDGTATGADYSATTPGTLTFLPGTTVRSIAVDIVNDTIAEASETVNLAISNPSNATLGAAAHSLRIDDNDGPPQVLFDAASSRVSEDGLSATVAVVLTGEAGLSVTVEFAQVGGTAVDSTDYVFTSNSPLTFAPGDTRQTIDISLIDNPTYELDRTLLIALSNLSTSLPGVTIGATSQHMLTIDDDDGPTVAFAAASASVGEGGVYTATLQLSQALLPGDSATVSLTSGGSASSPADYSAPASVTLTQADGTSKTFAITAADNQVDAADKTATLTLAPAAGSNLMPAAPATLTLTIQDDDETPAGTLDSYIVAEDATLTVAGPGVLGNDTDGDGDALSAVKLSDPASGALTLGSDGSLTYTPAANFNGPDSFTYRAQDPGGNLSAPVTVQITVTAVNDAPVAVADAYSTPANTALTITPPGVLVNDTDVEGDSLTATLVSAPENGTLTLSGDGALAYVPNPEFNGIDSFSYRVSDGQTPSATVTSTVRVGLSYIIMAPIAIGLPGTPDLVVSLATAPSGPSFSSAEQVTVTVTVTNSGTGATESGFWVDLYINPAIAPNGPNLPWNTICGIDPCRGIAWYVDRVLLPGESVTLRSLPGSYDAERSIWDGRLPAGARSVYVYADSWNPTVAYGAVREISEANNRAERAIQVSGVAAAAKQRIVATLPAR